MDGMDAMDKAPGGHTAAVPARSMPSIASMSSILRWPLALAAMLTALVAAAAEPAFAPAFDATAVDFARTRQFRDGAPAAADAEQVRRTLALDPAGANAEDRKWEAGAVPAGGEVRFEYLLVLKAPALVGTIAISPADFADNRGSRLGGELFYLKPGAAVPDTPESPAWERVEFAPAAPLLRFGLLPPGTRAQAFLFRDVRTGGTSRLPYWSFYARRLYSVTPLGAGYATGGSDPDGPTRGEGWSFEPKSGAISEATPAVYHLGWDAEQTLAGLFLYSNAARCRLSFYAGDPGLNPALAPAAGWRPLAPVATLDNHHGFRYWGCSFRWFSLDAVRTRALRVEVLGVDGGGKGVWLSGLAALTDLGDAPPPAPPPAAPVFPIAYTVPLDGEAAFVIDTPDGRRVRNLGAQLERRAGPATENWDLRDDAGRYVEPGRYRFHGIVAPPLELRYRLTPYPNVQQHFPDRVPWLTGHSGANGWLSDHSGNWACATAGDRLYVAASMAEAGVTLIECDLDGRKQWGRHDFGAWKGVYQMAADDQFLFVNNGEQIYRLDQATRAELNTFRPSQGPHRRGARSAMAARAGQVVLAYTGEPVFDSAAPADALDVARCFPKADGDDLARSLRLRGAPPGDQVEPNRAEAQGNGKLYLEAAPWAPPASGKAPAPKGDPDLGGGGGEGEDLDAHVAWKQPNLLLFAFRAPVPLGSVLFPYPTAAGRVRLSVLKPTAPYPPRPDREDDWLPFADAGAPGWVCVPAPPRTMTRALRVQLFPQAKDVPYWRLDGMRLLNARFRDVRAAATIRVNSGVVGARGEWDAQRTAPLAPDQPGLYVMEWPTPQTLAGLAFQEVEGAVTEVDVWQGAATGPVPLDGPACDRLAKDAGWRNVATYRQPRRSAEYRHCNKFARYLDGTVDFRETVTTRAVRLRFTEPWLDNGPDGDLCSRHDGRSEHGMHFRDSYCMKIDLTACRVHGVAALTPAGDDPPRDPLTYERLEIWDGATGKLVRELPVRPGWHGLAFSPAGELYVIEKSHQVISRVDQQTGALTPVLTDAQPSNFTIGPDGNFYVRPWADGAAITVYDATGQRLRTIGQPGGSAPGLWAPERLGNVHRMCVDRRGSLWMLESQDNPRRLVQFRTDGTFVKELLGNTHYGGGGSLDRTSSARVFHGDVEFAVDDATGRSQIRARLAGPVGDPLMRRVGGRSYLTSAPLTLGDTQAVGYVYLYDEATAGLRPVAAMGDAGKFAPLRRGALLALLKGKLPKDFSFLWADRNGNGTVDPDEVEFAPKTSVWHNVGVGMFDERLGVCGSGAYYAAAEFSAAGVPLYRREPAPGHPHYRLANGNYLTLHGTPGAGQPLQNFVCTPAGERMWGYPVANAGVSGLAITPWQPGLVGNEFGVIGHETEPAGELGEFVVVHANTGQWKLWTADGLLAGQVLLHKTDPRAQFLSFADAPPGRRLDPLTASQEHFHGCFTRSDADGRYFIVTGFTTLSLVEVRGLERFRRFAVDVTVDAAALERARASERGRAQRRIAARALQLTAERMARPPAIDGDRAPHEWRSAPATLPGRDDVSFSVGFDDQALYLCWQGRGLGPLKNNGDDFHRYFKTGAALDFLLGTDAAADPQRQQPARGDLRLLLTWAGGKPQAVLYQAVAPGAPAAVAWRTETAAGGVTAFARVVLLPEVTMAQKGERDVTVEVAVPLAALGLKPRGGERLKMDWGILSTGDGTQVKQRQYWANVLATGTADEAVEARLEPHLWGWLAFPRPTNAELEGTAEP